MNAFLKYSRLLLFSGSFYLVPIRVNAEDSRSKLAIPANQPPPVVEKKQDSAELAPSAAQVVIIDLAVNLVERGQVSAIIRGEEILLKVKDLDAAAVSTQGIGKSEPIDGEDYLALSSLAPAITYKFDLNLLKLALTSSADRLTDVNVKDLYNRNRLPPDTIFSRDSSAYINYALNYNRVQGTDGLSVFGEVGYSFDSSLASTTITRDPKGNIIRGLSSVRIDHSKSLDRWTIGDNFANLGELGGNLSVGGVSLSKEFSLNPYFVSTPQDSIIKGSVTTPSTVEIYNNGILIRREQLTPGQFELRNIERDNGLNNTTLVIRDAFGREQIVKTPFYFTSALLERGVSDYFVNVGFQRPSINDSNYQFPGVRGKYRWGVNSSLTAGVRLETATNLFSGGGEVAWKLPAIGEVSAGAAMSMGENRSGWAGFARYNYTEKNYTLGAALKLLSDNYAHSSLASIDDRNLFDASLQASVKLSDTTAVSARYSRVKSRNLGIGDVVGLDGSIRLSNDANLTISATRGTQPGNKGNDSIFAGININLGNSIRGNLGFQSRTSNSPELVAQVEKSLGTAEDWGYRIGSTYRGAANGNTVNGNLRYQNSIGLYELNYENNQGIDSTGINVAGGTIFIGGKTVLSRPLFNNSYSLVQVPGLAGVRVSVNSVEIGRTNGSGDLIIPNLQPYYANSISINLDDVPIEYRIEPASQLIAPPAKAGAIVIFQPQKIQNFSGNVLVKSLQKTLIPTYSNLIINVSKKVFSSPLSDKGEFYLENIPVGKHPATIEYEDKECKFDFQVPKVDRASIEMGTLECQVNF